MEVGILKGTGLAIWCDLFKDGRVLGLDIDLSHTLGNLENMKRKGAFKNNLPELHHFDQFLDNTDYLRNILHGDKINVLIDDGHHSNKAILTTLNSAFPFLAKKFVYIIEDNAFVHEEIRKIHPQLQINNYKSLTIINRVNNK